MAILVSGQIVKGDYEKFAGIVASNHPFVREVYLWSPGGLVEDGLKIGRLVRKGLLETKAPYSGLGGNPRQGSLAFVDFENGQMVQRNVCRGSNCLCASSCFIIWAAGVSREGTFLGIHRPSIKSTAFANLPPAQASVLYNKLQAEIGAYLREMEIPQPYIDEMTGTASNEIRWLDGTEAAAIREVPSISEWASTACGRFTNGERSKLAALSAIGMLGGNGLRFDRNEDEVEYRSLQSKFTALAQCTADRISIGRDSIVNILK